MSAPFSFWKLLVQPVRGVRQIVLPNQTCLLSAVEQKKVAAQQSWLKAKYRGRDFRVLAAGGVKLEATYFEGIDPLRGKSASLAAKTVLLFNGRDQYPHTHGYLVEMYQQRGFNVVTFNYRGIGLSEGQSSSIDSLIEDGIAVIDALEHYAPSLDRRAILLHGKSLGAGPASVAAVARAGVAIINDRSFAKFVDLATHLVTHHATGYETTRKLAALATPFFLQATAWDLDVTDSWGKIVGRKCIIYQPEDQVIPTQFSLYEAVKSQKPSAVRLPKNGRLIDGHYQKLKEKELDAALTMVGFL